METKKGGLVDWFVKNFVVPNFKNYKSPGFIIVKFNNEKGKEVYFREVLLPENLIADIESKVIKIYGNEGKELLYNIGVTLGYNFAYLFGVPSLKKDSKESIEKYANFTFKFNFSTWCKDAELSELDVDKHYFRLKFIDHVVCRNNGLGLILTEGAEAGFGKYMFSDDLVESVQINCQGKGSENCITLTMPKDELKNKKYKINLGKILYQIENGEKEKNMNLIRQLDSPAKSTYNMINNNIFLLKEGKIIYKNQVFFDCAVFLYYFIENYIPKLKNGNKILYEIGFDYGKKIAENEPLKFIPDILSSLGWGDISISNKDGKIIALMSGFPWSSLLSDVKEFNLFLGMLSGMVSSALKRDVNFKNVKRNIYNSSLKLVISE